MKGFFVAFDALPKESLMFLDLVQNTIFQKHNNNHNKALISKTYFSFVIPNIKVPFCGGGSFLEEEAYVQNTYFQYSGVGWKKGQQQIQTTQFYSGSRDDESRAICMHESLRVKKKVNIHGIGTVYTLQ